AAEVRLHRLENGGVDGGGRVVVEVDRFHSQSASAVGRIVIFAVRGRGSNGDGGRRRAVSFSGIGSGGNVRYNKHSVSTRIRTASFRGRLGEESVPARSSARSAGAAHPPRREGRSLPAGARTGEATSQARPDAGPPGTAEKT